MQVEQLFLPFHPRTSSSLHLLNFSCFQLRKVHIKLFFVAALPPEHGSSPNANGSDEEEGKHNRIHFGLGELFLSVCAQASYLGVVVGGGRTLSPSRSRGGGGDGRWGGGKETQLWTSTDNLKDLQIFLSFNQLRKQIIEKE